ncbi:MAG: NTP transferase domain-containing protein [Planctomycetota bacterium]
MNQSAPQAVVLAAGKGTRMKSELPKVLCEVVDRPMIHFVIEALRRSGVERIIVVVGYQAELVRESLADISDLVFVEQTEQLGTGHAVQMCRDEISGHSGPTIVVAGDSPLIQSDSLSKLLKLFHENEYALLLGTLIKDDPTGLGRIVRDSESQFIGIVEQKDASDAELAITEVNMSTYLFHTPDLLDSLGRLSNDNAQNEYYLTDLAKLLREAGRPVEASPVLQPCEALSINNPQELELVDQKMRSMGYA